MNIMTRNLRLLHKTMCVIHSNVEREENFLQSIIHHQEIISPDKREVKQQSFTS